MTRDLTPEILPHGPDAISLRLGLTPSETVLASVQTLRQACADQPPNGVVEIASSLTSVFLRFDPQRTTRATLTEAAQTILARTDLTATALPAPSRRWTIPVAIGGDAGPQFTEMAAAAGLNEQRAREVILTTPVRVLTIGFSPGLPYMGLLPPEWDVPRLSDITPNVPRGALVAAVRQLIIFTNPTPTGWRHIGMTAFHGFDPARRPASPLQSGDEIRFGPASASEIAALEADNPDGLGGARCEALT